MNSSQNWRQLFTVSSWGWRSPSTYRTRTVARTAVWNVHWRPAPSTSTAPRCPFWSSTPRFVQGIDMTSCKYLYVIFFAKTGGSRGEMGTEIRRQGCHLRKDPGQDPVTPTPDPDGNAFQIRNASRRAISCAECTHIALGSSSNMAGRGWLRGSRSELNY